MNIIDMRRGFPTKPGIITNGLKFKDSLTFNPLSLFKNTDQGVLYVPKNSATLFSGIYRTPISVGNSVRVMLDVSQGLNGDAIKLISPFLDIRDDSFAKITNSLEGTNIEIYAQVTGVKAPIFKLHKIYKLSITYTMPESSSSISVHNTDRGISNKLFDTVIGNRITKEILLYTTNDNLYFRGSNSEITIHDITLTEIKGTHAIQSDSTNRPFKIENGIDFSEATKDMIITLPELWEGTLISSTELGINKQIVSIPKGEVGLKQYFLPGKLLYGFIFVNRELTVKEESNINKYLG